MKHTFVSNCAPGLIAGIFLGLFAGNVIAQTDLSLDIQDTCQLTPGAPCATTPTRVFAVSRDGGFVALGGLGVGAQNPIVSGPGVRTIWYPWRAAFRVGEAVGSEWDHAELGFYSFAGGLGSQARGIYAFSYGNSNIAGAQSSVTLGQSNTTHGTSPDFATGGVALGLQNQVFKLGGVALGFEAVSGRTGTPAGGGGSGAVAIGRRVNALADHSVALGVRAQTSHAGAFAWSSTTSAGTMPNAVDTLSSSATGQFNVRAVGGVRMFTNLGMTSGMTMNAGGSAWNTVSDRDAKEDFRPVEGEALLEAISRVPVSTWRYLAEADIDVRHIGPVAQDWQREIAGPLGLNADDRTINQGDFDGVNLAAIAALHARTRDLQGENEALHERVASLEAAVQSLLQLQVGR